MLKKDMQSQKLANMSSKIKSGEFVNAEFEAVSEINRRMMETMAELRKEKEQLKNIVEKLERDLTISGREVEVLKIMVSDLNKKSQE